MYIYNVYTMYIQYITFAGSTSVGATFAGATSTGATFFRVALFDAYCHEISVCTLMTMDIVEEYDKVYSVTLYICNVYIQWNIIYIYISTMYIYNVYIQWNIVYIQCIYIQVYHLRLVVGEIGAQHGWKIVSMFQM